MKREPIMDSLLHWDVDLKAAVELPSRFSIVIPAYNEEANVAAVLTLFRGLYPTAEVILVDNNSKDETFERARQVEGVVLVSEPRPGKGAAMRAGLKAASREFVLFHDSDLEYNPRDCLAIMRQQIERHDVMVSGTRQISIGSLPWKSIAAMSVIRWVLRCRFGHLPGVDITTGTRSASKATWSRMNLQSDNFAIETEIVRNSCEFGIPIVSLPVSYAPRTVEQGKKIRAMDMFRLLAVALS